MWLGTFFISIICGAILILLLIVGAKTKIKVFSYVAFFLIATVLLLGLYAVISRPFYTKVTLDKNDFYGEYTIDREYFKGEQADWQYNHFRFVITSNDSILLHKTDGATIIETFRGKVVFNEIYTSTRVSFYFDDDQQHHIVNSQPTVYRDIWDFNIVLNSSRFYNMYFTKNKWKPLNH